MSAPKQSEVDAVADELSRRFPLTTGASLEGISRAAISALDKARGECVPVDELLLEIGTMWFGSGDRRALDLCDWITARGWLSDETPVVQTERRKP
jgi:hypothetical protein